MPFRVSIPVRFADVDAAGIVYYPRLLDICHQAFEELFQQLGPMPYHRWTQQLELGFPTRKLEAEFIAPVLYSDPIQVEISTSDHGTSSVCFRFEGQQLDSRGELQTCFQVKAWKVCCSLEGLQPTKIPTDVVEILQSIEGSK